MTRALIRQLRVVMGGLAMRKRWIASLLALSSLALLTAFRSAGLYPSFPQLTFVTKVESKSRETGASSLSRVLNDSQDLSSFVLQRSGPELDFRNQRQAHLVHPRNSLEHDKSNASGGEELTIVILTHRRRRTRLPDVLRNLIGLPGLRGVVIIWNGEKSTEDVKMPETPFPLQVLNSEKNSLNNRFLPLEMIETDAVLSMDDDMFPSQDSLLFAFRIWQEYRERIVGFPGRGVRWVNDHWVYDPSPSSVSMVLTGLAFFHKKYLSIYTYGMPAVIRQRVDNVTNCEDIAMNFLVSHMTQRSPIKVATTHWRCSGLGVGCKTARDSLWRDPKHFVERDACINFFAEVYGYMPLFKAEYRLDVSFEQSAGESIAYGIAF